MSDNFRYFGFTHAFSAQVTGPFDAILPDQAALRLDGNPDFLTARVDNFNFRDIFVFDRALAYVSASLDQKGVPAYDTTVSVQIEGLSILNMITADRVTARLASTRLVSGGEPRVTPIGSSFENLRIAGYKVEVDLAIEAFSRPEFDSFTAFRNSCQDESLAKHVMPLMRGGEFAPLPPDTIEGTLVRGIHGLGHGVQVQGNLITIRDFGRIRLADFTISKKSREITMIDFDLGSTPAGSGQAGGACGSGESGL